ncbi:MAG: glycerol-3-phosphate 1-O-acyltransferase PlsY [Deltaproteobacteria bacterium]|nr:glycerol-3-phosphate 1-O-acyltransferase PlsY [Deltaproteobacteria bacterium]
MIEVALIVSAYLLGSVPSGYLLGRLTGVDVRKAGSGNVGATNVARVLGKGQGVLTLMADAAKGWLPVYAALAIDPSLLVAILAGAAAFLGHLYPIFLRFEGGKGVATAVGVLLSLAPIVAMVLCGIFAVTVAASRVVSLGSMAAAVAAPFALWIAGYPPMVVATGGFMAAMITWRHRGNIRRLLAGTEPRFGTSNSR